MTTALPALTSHVGLILYGGTPCDAARRHASRRARGCNSGAPTRWSCDQVAAAKELEQEQNGRAIRKQICDLCFQKASRTSAEQSVVCLGS